LSFPRARPHAYAWTSPRNPRICVTRYHPAKQASKSTLMRGQSRLCVAQLSKS
ncbi:hypothetical protein PIB30_102991, partial [Stylosanthes scabra]|nr:hypothetical protein [Stylosanthes scabra]